MKTNIFHILKQMLGCNSPKDNSTQSQTPQSSQHPNREKYIPNPCDLMIIAGESSLVLTSDQSLGGLWNILDFDPCSGSTSECLAEMKTLLDEHLDEAYDSLIFPLGEENVFILNMNDSINRSACNEDGMQYKQFIDDKLDVFYPVIKMFVEKNSSNKTVGITIYYGGGTGIGHYHLSELLMNDGFRCVIEGSKPPFLFKESLSESLAINGIGEYEEFDCRPYIDMTVEEYFHSGVRQLLSAMKDRLKERMNKKMQAKDVHDIADVPEFFCPEYKKLSEYGYIRTIADIIKVLNRRNCYTNPKALEHDLETVLAPYRKRGTVSQSSIDAFRILIKQYSDILFNKKGLVISVLAHIIEKIPHERRSPIDEVFCIREKAKILYAMEFANKICKYTNPNNLIHDLQELFWGSSTLGWHPKLLDDVHPHIDYGVRFFLENIEKAWPSITCIDCKTKERTLNNELLESYMFTNHEKKVLEKGLVSTLKEDYEEVHGCYSTRFMPKSPGIGPIYVINDDKQIQRACHPSDDTLVQQYSYEAGIFGVLMENLVDRHEYREYCGYREYNPIFIPIGDYSRPIYGGYLKEMKFKSREEKLKFIEEHKADKNAN